MTRRVLAVDVGGTKMAAGIVTEAGALVERVAVPTPRGADAEALFTALTEAVRAVDPRGAIACGVGSGGPMDRGGEHVSPVNIHGWRSFPLRSRLEALTDSETRKQVHEHVHTALAEEASALSGAERAQLVQD